MYTYETLGISELTQQILKTRRISPEDAKELLFMESPRSFLKSSLKDETATALSLIQKARKIGVFCDYDSDGIMSFEVLRTFLSGLGKTFTPYIPERSEKYGLSRAALRNLANRGIDLLITADCGSSDLEELMYAKTLGISTIVTDHHKYAKRPPVDAFINPVGTEFKSLSGCSVAGLTLQDLSSELFLETLPFMAVATIGDLVPLHQESRFLVAEFLEFPKFPGILEAAFKDVVDFDTIEIAFNVVPKLNSLSRMGTAKSAMTLHKQTVLKSSKFLQGLNAARKNRQRELTNIAMKLIDPEPSIIVVQVPETSDGHGFYGLIASRIVEKFKKPALVGGVIDGRFKGSGRSIPGINLYGILEKVSESCDLEFGGHSVALGFSAKSVEKVREAIQALEPELRELDFTGAIVNTDLVLDISELDRIIEPFSELWPFGSGNPHLQVEIANVRFDSLTKNGFFHETRIGKTKFLVHPEVASKSVLKTSKDSVCALISRATPEEIVAVIQ